jgi:hypothetical protein
MDNRAALLNKVAHRKSCSFDLELRKQRPAMPAEGDEWMQELG